MSVATGFTDFRKRKDQNFLQILNRILLILIVLLITCGLVAAFVPAIKQRSDQRAALEQIQRGVAEQKLLFQNRSKEVARLKTDPEYLGNIARDKLELMKEGETIFRFDAATASASPITH